MGCYFVIRAHYVEYLVGQMRTVDPLPIMDLSEMVAELRRLAIPLPDRGPWDTDPIYTEMCAKVLHIAFNVLLWSVFGAE